MFALSLYSVSHKFTLAPTVHKGRSKGKKLTQQNITACGNRRTVTYVRIYYSGGFQNMDKYIFDENNGLWYELIVNYYFPCLTVPAEDDHPVGVWGQRHRRYLKEYRPALYNALLLSNKLNGYLADIDQQAQEMMDTIIQQMAEAQGITETMKAADPMAWVGRMNNNRVSATEIVNAEIISP